MWKNEITMYKQKALTMRTKSNEAKESREQEKNRTKNSCVRIAISLFQISYSIFDGFYLEFFSWSNYVILATNCITFSFWCVFIHNSFARSLRCCCCRYCRCKMCARHRTQVAKRHKMCVCACRTAHIEAPKERTNNNNNKTIFFVFQLEFVRVVK